MAMDCESQVESPTCLGIHNRFPTVNLDRIYASIERATNNPMVVQVVVHFNGRLDEDILAQAIWEVIRRNPYLACRFHNKPWGSRWQTVADLSTDQLLEVRDTDGSPADVQAALSRPSGDGCSVEVLILRGKSDTLYFKLDHKMGDAHSAKDIAYELADTYSSIARGEALPPWKPETYDRSIRQTLHGMSSAERRALMDSIRKASPIVGGIAPWKIQSTHSNAEQQPTSEFIIKTVEETTVSSISDYASKKKVTVNTVLAAAFSVAALRTIPRKESPAPYFIQTVDLRRYLPSKRANAPCNLAGLLRLSIDHHQDEAFDLHVESIGDQVATARRNFIGLCFPALLWELVYWRRLLVRCIPFSFLVLNARHRERGPVSADRGANLMLSNMGGMDETRLRFHEHRPRRAYITSGALKGSKLLLFSVTEFGGSITLTVGFSPKVVSRSLASALMDSLGTVLETLPVAESI